MAAPIVWLNGFPGVGKLTVAKEIGAQEKSAIIISNHSLIDPVHQALGPSARSHPDYQRLRKVERDRALGRWIRDPAFKGNIVVFTDCQLVDELGVSVAQEYKAAAQEAGRPFLPYHLVCEREENVKRATSKERQDSGTTKLTNEKLLRSILTQAAPYMFEESRMIAVDSKSPEEVARSILHDCSRHFLGHLSSTEL